MIREEFERLLDGFGPDPAHWPETRRDAAAELLRRDAVARRGLEAARALEAALTGLPVEPASDALRRSVLDIPLAHPRPARRAPPYAHLLARTVAMWRTWSAGALAASFAMLMGFYLGYGGTLVLPGLTDAAAATPEQELVELVASIDAAIGTDELP